MIVVDSSVWIDFFADRATEQVGKLRTIDHARTIVVGDVVLLEVLRGARDSTHAAALERAMRSFQVRAFLDPELAVKGAAHYRTLRARGVTIRRAVDVIIGTYCLEYGHRLLHNDRDFTVMCEHLGLTEL